MVVTFPHPEVTSRYLFGSPWIPELMFVVGKLTPEVLELYHRERQEAYMSNQALYNMSSEEKAWHQNRCRAREESANSVKALATQLKRDYNFQNVGVEAVSLVLLLRLRIIAHL